MRKMLRAVGLGPPLLLLVAVVILSASLPWWQVFLITLLALAVSTVAAIVAAVAYDRLWLPYMVLPKVINEAMGQEVEKMREEGLFVQTRVKRVPLRKAIVGYDVSTMPHKKDVFHTVDLDLDWLRRNVRRAVRFQPPAGPKSQSEGTETLPGPH